MSGPSHGNSTAASVSALQAAESTVFKGMIDKPASDAALAMKSKVDEHVLGMFKQESPLFIPVIFPEDWDVDEWDGDFPDPYGSIDPHGDAFASVHNVLQYDLIDALMAAGGSMRFNLTCNECDDGRCNVSNGLDQAPCHGGSRNRKDGFYVGDFS